LSFLELSFLLLENRKEIEKDKSEIAKLQKSRNVDTNFNLYGFIIYFIPKALICDIMIYDDIYDKNVISAY